MKKLVAFYSRADENFFGGQYRYVEVGNTEIAAKMIAKMTGADLFKIEQKEPYSADYKECRGDRDRRRWYGFLDVGERIFRDDDKVRRDCARSGTPARKTRRRVLVHARLGREMGGGYLFAPLPLRVADNRKLDPVERRGDLP